MEDPVVSVLMPVRNAGVYLEAAVRSVLDQRFAPFELLVVDDASTDDSPALLARLADPRLRVIRLDRGEGVAEALNRAMEQARGRYLARMDADDVSDPERLSLQVAFMERHGGTVVLGSRIRYLGPQVPASDFRPLSAEACDAHLVFGTPVVHPSVMMRREVLLRTGLRYDGRHSRSEDYALWLQLRSQGAIQNLARPLLTYRVHAASVTGQHGAVMQSQAGDLQRGELQRLLGRAVTEAELTLHQRVAAQLRLADREAFGAARDWMQLLRAAGRGLGAAARAGLDEAVAIAWFHVCVNSAQLGFWGWRAGRQGWRAAAPPARLRWRYAGACLLHACGLLGGKRGRV